MTQSRAGRSADAQVAPRLDSIDEVQSALAAQRYIADRGLATAVFLALKRHKPLLLEGEPGVGKTEIARALAAALGTELIRLQCYEGIDQSMAVYEWNYARQLLYIRSLEATKGAGAQAPARRVRAGVPHPPPAAPGARRRAPAARRCC